MDSGEAALWGAAIGAGSTLVVSTLVPLVSATLGERLRSERRRKEQLREVFPKVVAGVISPNDTSFLALIAQFQVLLRPDEWPMGEMALIVAAQPSRSPQLAKSAGAMNSAVTAWLRGEITPEQARKYFVQEAGLPVTQTTFPA